MSETGADHIRNTSGLHVCVFVGVLRPGSLTRPSKRTCPSLLWRNTKRTKSTEMQRRAEVCVGLTANRNHLHRSCAETGGGQTVLSVLSGSHEEFHQHGFLRQQEDQTQAEEVPDPPADAAVRQRQGLHQRYHQRTLRVSILWLGLTFPRLCFSDQVFGCSLSDLCHRENTTVPTFVKMCIEHVENSSGCL